MSKSSEFCGKYLRKNVEFNADDGWQRKWVYKVAWYVSGSRVNLVAMTDGMTSNVMSPEDLKTWIGVNDMVMMSREEMIAFIESDTQNFVDDIPNFTCVDNEVDLNLSDVHNNHNLFRPLMKHLKVSGISFIEYGSEIKPETKVIVSEEIGGIFYKIYCNVISETVSIVKVIACS